MSKAKKAKKNIKHPIFLLGILVVILFVLEALFLNSLTKIEGVKIGLYNVFIVLAIMELKPRHGYTLAAIKIIASIFIVTGIISYPLCGGLLSVTAMVIAKKLLKDKVGYLGVGIIGALTYNISVYVAAALSLSSLAVFYNIPTVLFLSVLYGAITGGLAYLLSKTNIASKKHGGNNE